MAVNLSVDIGSLHLKNPVMVASGTFGYGRELERLTDINKLGAIVTKTVTLKPRPGNPPPRTCETAGGMLNSVGLDNPGIEVFIRDKMPRLKKSGVPVIVSIASEKDPEEFLFLARRLDKIKEVAAIELNISCPNLKKNSLISQDPGDTRSLISKIRKSTRKTIIAKLSPNVTSITEIALAAQNAGADALAMINTLSGMCIDVRTRKPKLANVTGGLSGPAIRPVAVKMVWQAYKEIRIPIIGMGGIIDTESALELIIAGATAVSIGTANFVNPATAAGVVFGLKEYLSLKGIKDIRSIIGSARV